jgi:hypothetical protein
VTIHALGYQAARARLQFLDTVPLDRETAARGALAGAVAAGVWAAQSPLDTRVFRWPYLDQELLGKLVTRGRGWLPVGVALHVANGALFGALYANAAPSLPGPHALRGAAAGLAEHLAMWPGTLVIDRMDLGRDFPKLWGDPRAFGQATWRHLLFGAILGELERRLNPPETDLEPVDAAAAASNGHGSAEHLVTTGP